MTILSSRKWIAAAGLAVGIGVLSPATASADAVDDLLNRFPSGQISCEQANSYWTNEADYNNKRSQAQMLANFHPRGGEIRDALARVEEAANRCGLKGGGAPANQAPANQAPANQAPANQAPANQAPARQTPANQAPANQEPARQAPANQAQAPQAPVIPILVAPGVPSVTVPVAGVANVEIPDLVAIVTEFLEQFVPGQLPAGSSLPF